MSTEQTVDANIPFDTAAERAPELAAGVELPEVEQSPSFFENITHKRAEAIAEGLDEKALDKGIECVLKSLEESVESIHYKGAAEGLIGNTVGMTTEFFHSINN